MLALLDPKLGCAVKSETFSSYATSWPGLRRRRGLATRASRGTHTAKALASSPFMTSASEPMSLGGWVCASGNGPSGGTALVARGSSSTIPGWNRHPPRRTSPSTFQPYSTLATPQAGSPPSPAALPGEGMGSTAPGMPTGSAMCHTSPVLCVVGFSASSMVSGASPSPWRHCRNSVTFAARALCSAKLHHPGPAVGPRSTARDAPSGYGLPGAAPTGTANAVGGSCGCFRLGMSYTTAPSSPGNSGLGGFCSTSTKFISSGA